MTHEPITPTRRRQILDRLCQIAATSLDVEPTKIDVHCSFLELGIDSLTLMDISRAIQDGFGVTLSIRLLLEEISTFDNLAAYIDHAAPSTAEPVAPVGAVDPPPGVPLAARVSAPSEAREQPLAEPAALRSTPEPPAPAAIAAGPPPLPEPRPPVMPAALAPAGASAVERVVSQQLQLMALQVEQQRLILGQQLALLGGAATLLSTGSSAAVSAPPVPGAVAAEPAATGRPHAPAPRSAAHAGPSEGTLPVPLREAPESASTSGQRSAPAPSAPPQRPLPNATAAQAPAARSAPSPEPFVPYRPINPGSAGGLSPAQQAHLDAFRERYVRRTRRSREYAERHRGVFAENRATVGFQLNTKEMLYPIVAERSRGARFWDLDGNEYIDLAMGFGVLLFGHSPDFIVQALQAQVQKGYQLGPQCELAGEVAQRLSDLTGLERVAFANTGSEAVMVALRLARTATGRPKVVTFSGAFHGSYDQTLMRSRKFNGEERAVPIAPGIPRGMGDDIVVLDYDRPESLEAVRALGHQVAAVLVEPVQSRRPELQPGEFLRELRRITAETGAALIFDEVITGFRTHPRGAQGHFDVQADMALYGKVLAGGMPIGVVAGSPRFLNSYDGGPWSYGDNSYPRALTSFFAGTFSKHPLTMASARAVLHELALRGPGLQQGLNRLTAGLVERLDAFFAAEELPIRMTSFGSLFRFQSALNLDLFFYHLAERGLYTWEGRTCFLSTAHTEADLERVLRAVRESVAELRQAGFLPPGPGGGGGNRLPVPERAQPEPARVAEPVAVAASPATVAAERPHAPSLDQGAEPRQPGAALAAPAAADRPGAPVRSMPLTEGQQGFWLFSQFSAEASSASAESMVLRLKGALQVEAMRGAMRQVVERHEALRTTMDPSGERQHVWPPGPVDIPLIDFLDRPPAEREPAVFQWLTEQKAVAFDLVRGPLWNCSIVRIHEDDHLLVLTIHHLVVDGWSLALICQELTRLYPAAVRGERAQLPAPMQYHEYVAWEERERTTPGRAASEAFWAAQYADRVPLMDLPSDRPRPGVATYRGAREHRRVDDALYLELKALGARHGATLFMTLFSAYTIFLHRLTGQDDLVIGSPSVRRSLPGSEGLVGFSLNMLPLRVRMGGDPTFGEHVARVKRMLYDSYEHGDCPIGAISHKLNLPRDPSRPVFATVQFNLNPRIVLPRLGDLSADLVPRPISFTPFDLFLDGMEINGELRLDFLYNTGLFERTTMRRWMDELIVLLESIVAAPERRASQFELLSASERRQIVRDWNQTEVAFPERLCVHDLVEAQVARTPDAPAVECGGQTLTYRELNERANQVARFLEAQGVGPESMVGVCFEPSLDLAVAVLGLLKAGGVYMPLDPAYPQERLAFMLEDADVRVLLAQRHLQARLPEHRARLVSIEDAAQLASHGRDDLGRSVSPDQPAFVVYTSGSTGRPKGAQVRHQSVVSLFGFMGRKLRLGRDDRLLALASLSFDVSFAELFLPLVSGATLLIVPRAVAADGLALLKTLIESRATLIQATPATWRLLLSAGWSPGWPGQERFKVLCCGEVMSRELANDLMARAPVVWNLYGPTETTIYSTQLDVRPGEGTVLLGGPVDNTRIHVVDAALQPVPIGVTGEIVLAGVGLSRGYLHRPALTAEKFVPDPFGTTPGARLYRSGDMGRYHADGQLEFVARVDHQVKVRGQRVELGEIEACLSAHPAVRQAVVVASDSGPNDKHLNAYVVAQAGGTLDADELRAHVRRSLPEYMVPSWVVVMDALPLTPNGKVDRFALPAPHNDLAAGEAEDFVAPATPMERIIADIWREVLGLEKVSADESFFHLGGHSLQGTQVLARLRDLFAIDLSLTNLFESPTVAGMAAVVAERQRAGRSEARPGATDTAGAVITPRARTDEPPALSYAQQRLWFLAQLEPESPAYNLAHALRLRGTVDVAALERSLREIESRHESLRTLFASHEGRPLPVVHAAPRLALHQVDLSPLSREEREAAVERFLAEETYRPFDLAQGPLLRVSLLRLEEQEHVLVLAIHHIVSDGWSNSVFTRELALLYEAFAAGRPSPLEPLPIQYADYAQWQREHLQGERLAAELDYWKGRLAGAPALLELPADRPRPALRRYRGAYHAFTLPRHAVERLHGLARATDTTLFMVLLAAFQALLSRWSGQEDVVVGSPIANRGRVETEGLIGIFINTLAMRVDLSGAGSFREVLARVREVALGAYAHQDLPFEVLVEHLQPERSLSYAPLFQVMFVLQNTPPATVELAGLSLGALPIDRTTAKFDLTLNLEEGPDGLSGGLQYDRDLFEADTIDRLAGQLGRLLSALPDEVDAPLASLSLLTREERRALLEQGEGARADWPGETVPELIAAQARRAPDATALVCDDLRLDYAEVERRANRLAHCLRAAGVGAESRVGLYLERSADTLLALLAVLKAGGAYVPIDPAYPRERAAFMAKDAGVRALLVHGRLAAGLPELDAQVIALDDWSVFDSQPDSPPPPVAGPSNLAYVIYTSGSTGRPKAVAVEHRQLVNYAHGAVAGLDLPEGASYATVSTFAADLGHTMIFPALMRGGALHVVTQERASEPQALADYLRREAIDCLKIVPSHLSLLMSAREPAFPRRRLVLGGEAARLDWIDRVHGLAGDCAVYNHYGPTETTVGVLTHRAVQGQSGGARQSLPLGRPLPNTRVYVVDGHMQPQPVGLVGELYVGGAGVARGYLGRPDLSAERFVPDPFSGLPGERLYRTGDLVRVLSDGSLEFVGRADQQVKVRGYRVELEEIEAALAAHPGVAQAVVHAWYQHDPERSTRLAAYVVARADSAPAPEALRQFLRERLPEHMLPASFTFLEALPLGANGKLDRRALPEPDRDRPQLGQAYVAPTTAVEQVLCGIWCEVLEVERVGVHDNFFELGGHSLLATQVTARIFKVFEVELPLRRLFEAPTVAGLQRALFDEAGESQPLERTAELLMRLAGLSDDELELQLAGRAANGG